MNLWFEVKYAVRALARNPLHTTLAITVATLSVALAIVAMVLVYNVRFKPLPLPASDHWVHLSTFDSDSGLFWGSDSVDVFRYQAIKQYSDSFVAFGAIRANSYSRLHDGNSTLRISSGIISPHLFQAANMRAHLGRTLLPDDAGSQHGGVATISYELWTSYFAQDRNVIGRTIQLDETPHTIVGVMPAGTHLAGNHQVWIPMTEQTLPAPSNRIQQITPIGIVKPTLDLAQVQAELRRIVDQINADYPDFYNSAFQVKAVPLHLRGSENGTLIYTAIGLVACGILLLGCLNLGNLSVVRQSERSQEIAVRNALGASKRRLLGQALIETSLVTSLGIGLGLPAALLGLTAMSGAIESMANVPPHWHLGFDAASGIIAAITMLSVWLLSALLPAWRLLKAQPDAVLRGGRKGADTSTRSSAMRLVVGLEVIASCFLLVVSAGLLLAIDSLLDTDYGIATDNRFAVEIELSRPYQDTATRNAFLTDLQRELEKLPVIEAAAFSTALPNDIGPTTYHLMDRAAPVGAYPMQYVASVSPSWMELLDVKIVAGRGLEASDGPEAELVAIVDERFANAMWPDGSALGKQIQLLPESNGATFTIVGIAHNVTPQVRYGAVSTDSIVYLSMLQRAQGRLQIVVSSTASRADVFAAVSGTVSGLDSFIAVYNPRSLTEHLAIQTKDVAVLGALFSIVGLVTLFLAATGIFAVISRAVGQQTRDIGVRRAVGSSASNVLWRYLRQGSVYLIAGAIIGGGAAVLINAALAQFFVTLLTFTPVALVLVLVLLFIIIAVATWMPARKAVSMEPGDALRYE